ncbi:MAG TPA: thiamine phosphate synthase [Longimicrobiaceae bacterium]
MKPNPIPPLHVVTGDAVVAREDFLRQAKRVLRSGGPNLVFHLRAPRASGRRLHDLVRALRDPVMGEDAWLVVNDRVDVALAACAEGAHLGSRGLHPADARRVMGPGYLLGVSVHSADEAREARAAGADYVVAGNVWETPSHPGRPGAGVGLVREIAAVGIPTIAIGGVTPERAGEAREAGAAGIAAIRGVWDAPDPGLAVWRYLEAWRSLEG